VKLRETGTFAEFIERVQGHIEYQIEKKRRIVFGLTKLGEGEMKLYSWPFDRQLSLEKYLFLDFARNPQGEIIYAQKNMRGTVPAPETYILKLVSPDPEDGFISINEQVKDWSYLTDAPDTAYTSKELVLPYNGECLTINRKYYFYIKCGNFYGKGRASTPSAGHDEYHVYVTIMFNEIPGDRNLRSEPWYW
jgi:hypothetical protein